MRFSLTYGFKGPSVRPPPVPARTRCYERRSVLRLLRSFSNHQRHRLPVELDLLILQHMHALSGHRIAFAQER